MKVVNILKPFVNDLVNFIDEFGNETSDDDCFYIMIDDTYYSVQIKNSYWYYEDDGTVVFRVNDE